MTQPRAIPHGATHPAPKKQRGAAATPLPALQPWTPDLRIIPVAALVFHPANPRGDAADDLDGLIASLDVSTEPHLVQPPTVEVQADRTYLVQMGERRVRSVTQAGWQTIACLVVEQTDPYTALIRRLAENMQRRDLHPLDEAASLKSAWLYANAVALGAEAHATAVLAESQTPLATLEALAALVDAAGFIPTHPLITRQQVLGLLGITVSNDRLKQMLKVLALDTPVLRDVRALDMTEAAIRSLAALAPDQQRVLVDAIAALPALGRQVRWIVVNMRDRGYSFDEALAQATRRAERNAEARASTIDALPDATALDGLDDLAATIDAQSDTVRDDDASAPPDDAALPGAAAPGKIDDSLAMERALPLLEAANAVNAAGADLIALLDGQPLTALPEPWYGYVLAAAQIVATTLKTLPLQSSREHRGVS